MSLETRIYQKENKTHILKLLIESLRDIYKSRFLSRQLAIRDIKAQYRQSYFGILWAFIMPLTTAFIWIFLNRSGTIQLSDTGIPYPVYAFSGTLLWAILTDAINSPILSTTSAKSMLSKINFPKEALIVSGVYKLLFSSGIKLVLLFVFLIIYNVGLNWTLILFPFAILGVITFGITVGLFLTPMGMLYKDVAKIISIGLGFAMYATPVVYAVPNSGIMKTIMEYNPLTPLINTARDLVVGLSPAYLTYFLIIILVCLPLFFLALIFYRISIPIIVERMSS